MSVGVFDFHDYSMDLENDTTNDRMMKVCLNRFTTCRSNPSSHQYILDPRIKTSKSFIIISFQNLIRLSLYSLL